MRQPTRFTPARVIDAIVRGITATYKPEAAATKLFELSDLLQDIGMVLECGEDGEPADLTFAPRRAMDVRIIRELLDGIDATIVPTDVPEPDMIS